MRRSLTLPGMSSGLVCVVPSHVLPSRVMAHTMASLLSAACMAMGFLVFAKSTETPLDNMGVMTMKMISRTSITSTMGVTLMSATGGGALNLTLLPVILFLPALSPWIAGDNPGSLAGSP